MSSRGTSLMGASLMVASLIGASLTVASLTTGCGFHLQGSAPLPRSLAVVRIDAIDTQSDFYFGLRKALMAAGTSIDDSHNDSNAVIHIINDSAAERILSVSTLNVPTEYELTYALKFSVTLGAHELIAVEEHRLVRDYSYSESALLAKEREKSILSEALANDLVSVVMRRLSSLSGAPGAASADATH
ncbi:MAG TPA: LPS assembly lipoprotein LptE [Steroidobacteraceae bacterium]|jgi:LPS-assembly lipoprotein|nr:LPS assembly lipoprotein LptE [Steroidobacteraceae bacterium]